MKLIKKISILLLLVVIFLIALVLTACNKTVSVYFSEPTYHIILESEGPQKQIIPTVITRPRGQSYSLKSLNTSILKVEKDGKTVTALREGAVTLQAEVNGVIGSCNVLIYPSPKSPIIPNNLDNKVSVYFVTEEGSFPSQRLSVGEYATDPTSSYNRPGYQLFGWYTSPEYKESTKFDFENTQITKTTTLYALWGINPDFAEFKFETIDGKVYVTGLAHSYIPYDEIILPTTNKQDVPVDGVKAYAFSENKNATKIVIPDNYTYIGRYAFNEMEKLDNVEIGAGIEQIDEGAFADNASLQTVTIGGTNALLIGESAFINSVKLENLTIPDTTTTIGNRAFYNANLLSEFTTPASLQTIGAYAFYNNALTSFDLKNVKEVGEKAFWGCTKLANITNGHSLNKLGSYAFGQITGTEQKNATAWLKTKNNNNPDVVKDHLIYIGKMLVYAYNDMVKPTFYVKAYTEYLASRCFADTQNAIITFEGETPPIGFGEYVFGYPTCQSDIIVPKNYPGKNFMKNYIDKFLVPVQNPEDPDSYLPTAYSLATVNRFYQKVPTPSEAGSQAIEIYKRYEVQWVDGRVKIWKYQGHTIDGTPGNPGEDPPKLRLLIGGWNLAHLDTENNQPQNLDINLVVKTIAMNENGSNPYVVERVVSNAFQQLNNVKKIYMPIKILRIDTNAFSILTSCEGIYFGFGESDAGEWTPSSTVIDGQSFNFSQMPTCKIYVPKNRVTDYKAVWKSVELRIFADS